MVHFFHRKLSIKPRAVTAFSVKGKIGEQQIQMRFIMEMEWRYNKSYHSKFRMTFILSSPHKPFQ